MMQNEFHRGDIWFFDPDPTRGREQKKLRPCLILSVDTYNNGPADLLIILPLTTKKKSIPCHLEIEVEGLTKTKTSYVMCDQIRCVSKDRFTNIQKRKPTKIASVNKKTLEEIERCLKVLLGFS